MSRTFEETHPWISFTINLGKFTPELWLLLGEGRSKCEHLAGAPLRPETARKLHMVYLAKGIQGTTAIEGNTLSEQQVEAIIEGKLKMPPSKEYLEQEVKNILVGCDTIWTLVSNHKRLNITPEIIRSFNKMVLNGLKLEEGAQAGEVRNHNVGVFRYRGAPPEDCEYLLGKLCSWLAEAEGALPDYMGRVGKAIVLAAVAHLYIAWIHPFGDGNGRTARLLEFAILLEAGVPTPAAHLLSNHYNVTRTEYYRQLDYASKSGGEIVPFIYYATQGFVDSLREQIRTVREQQLDVVWRNYVFEKFKDQEDSAAQRRCKHLILDLASKREFVPRKDLMTLSTRLVRHYQGKGERTLARDLNSLRQLGLLARDAKRGYRAKREVIEAFLPGVKTDETEEVLPSPSDAPSATSHATGPVN